MSVAVDCWPGPGAAPWWWGASSPGMRRAYIGARERYVKTEKRLAAAERKGEPLEGAQTLRLTVTALHGFGCKDYPHFAVALADLDCRVRIHEGAGFSDISAGAITFPGGQGFGNAYGRQTMPGEVVRFEVVGLDADEALPVIRETFAKGREDHLAVVRKWWRMREQKGAA